MKNLIKSITQTSSKNHLMIAKAILYISLAVFIYTILSFYFYRIL